MVRTVHRGTGTRSRVRFDPTSEPRVFRDALGSFATGVCVVTTRGEQGPVGITVNSFSSVSLDPPLVLWCPAKNSTRYDAFINAPHFAIHVLREDQEDAARAFVSQADAFMGLTPQDNPRGVPTFDDCVARFDCDLETTHDAGDHTIIIGRVTEAFHRPGKPLLFHAGRFGPP